MKSQKSEGGGSRPQEPEIRGRAAGAAGVMRDALALTFGEARSIRRHAGLLVCGPLFLILSWPDSPLSFYIARERGPQTFRVVASAAALFLGLTAAGWSLYRISGRPPRSPLKHRCRDWFIGRTLYHLLHSVLAVLIVLPALVSAAGASLLPPRRALEFALLLTATFLGLRLIVEAGRGIRGPDGPMASNIYITGLIVYALLTSYAAPDWSIFRALAHLADSGQPPGVSEDWVKPLMLHALLTLTACIIGLLRLRHAGRIEEEP